MYTAYKNNSSENQGEVMELPRTQEELFQELKAMKFPDENKSLVRKHLTDDVFDKLKNKKTKLGGTLGHVFCPAVLHPSCSIGLLVTDPEAYDTFSLLTHQVIKDYHKLPLNEPLTGKHPKSNFGDVNNLPFGNLDPSGERILSTRVRVGRTVQGYSMVTQITKAARLEMEQKIQKCLESMTGQHKGKYYKLAEMSEDDKKALVMDHFMFNDREDPYLECGGAYRDWPHGRGIYHNDDKTFLIWNNEEDHLRIISMQKGGDLAEVYKRLQEGIQMLEKAVGFVYHKDLGWVTSCPTNLGTAMRASVHCKIPKLAERKEELTALCEKYGIQPRGIHGEISEENEGGVFDLSNKRRLGITELEAVQIMAEGVQAIIKRESEL